METAPPPTAGFPGDDAAAKHSEQDGGVSVAPASPATAAEASLATSAPQIVPGSPFAAGLNRPVLGFLILIHSVPILLCVLFPSWPGLGMMVVLYLLTGLGVTIGYHRKLTHHSFKAPRWVDHCLAVLGLLSGEGPPMFWVAHHRKHHKFSDVEGDPHSPLDGAWWSHMLWLLPKQSKMKLGSLYGKRASDLIKDPFYTSLESTYLLWHGALLLGLLVAGWVLGGWYMAGSFVAYGFFLRMLLVLHATWMVNSVSHMWGYKSYETQDDSRNNALVALVAQGEGWHNNHHHLQATVNHGHRWWEIDVSFAVIYLAACASLPLKWIGLGAHRPVYHLKFYSHRLKKTRVLFPGE
jgi:fatty-acid desaturase